MSDTATRLLSTLTDDGRLRLHLDEGPLPEPGPDQILVRVQASPINPSDLGMLLAGADPATLEPGADGLTGPVPAGAVAMNGGRLGHAMPVGNEGAGTVVATGSSEAASALAGKVVAGVPGGMYATHRLMNAADAWVMPDGTDPRDAASPFVNPMTVLMFMETMREEGHTALVHTVGASNLGHMLRRVCAEDGVSLVEIVRKPEQVGELRAAGAEHALCSTDDDFEAQLEAALRATGATLCFDAIGGGSLAGTILAAMERAQADDGAEFSRYGSDRIKQVYVYGGLDRSPTVLARNFGMGWSVGGWVLPHRLPRVAPERVGELRQRIIDGLTTTFASPYTAEISLAEMLDPEIMAAYTRMASGEKYLVTP